MKKILLIPIFLFIAIDLFSQSCDILKPANDLGLIIGQNVPRELKNLFIIDKDESNLKTFSLKGNKQSYPYKIFTLLNCIYRFENISLEYKSDSSVKSIILWNREDLKSTPVSMYQSLEFYTKLTDTLNDFFGNPTVKQDYNNDSATIETMWECGNKVIKLSVASVDKKYLYRFIWIAEKEDKIKANPILEQSVIPHWIFVTSSVENDKWYVRSEYEEKNYSTIKIWAKVIFPSLTINKKTYKNAYKLLLIYIDCKNKKAKEVTNSIYTEGGKLIDTDHIGDGYFKEIIPDSVMEAVYQFISKKYN
jgi:hypothetical protein